MVHIRGVFPTLLPACVLVVFACDQSSAYPEEFASPADEGSAAEARSPAPYVWELEVSGGVQDLSDTDMNATYGVLPGGGVALGFADTHDTVWVLRLQYLASKGNPFHDLDGFESGTESKVQAMPLSLGIRHNLAGGPRLRLNVGALLMAGWIRESLPDAGDPGRLGDDSDFGGGFGFTLGSELRTADHRRAYGLEFNRLWFATDGDSNSPSVNLSGFQANLYVVFRLGSQPAAGEVSP